MNDLEENLNRILSNPQMMQQIFSLAQSMNPAVPESTSHQKPEPSAALPTIDPGMLRKMAGLARKTSVDPNQHALLRALGPYVSHDRVRRLEKAMQAAKLASFATSLLHSETGR